MNASKRESILNNATAISKRVFDSVPISEPWTIMQIHNDMIRQGKGSNDLKMTSGCLNSLKDIKLITETSLGHFMQRKVTKVKEKNLKVVGNDREDISLSNKKEKPIDKLFRAATSLKKLGIMLKEVAEDIETATLQFEEEGGENAKEFEKLKQLSSLLKELA